MSECVCGGYSSCVPVRSRAQPARYMIIDRLHSTRPPHKNKADTASAIQQPCTGSTHPQNSQHSLRRIHTHTTCSTPSTTKNDDSLQTPQLSSKTVSAVAVAAATTAATGRDDCDFRPNLLALPAHASIIKHLELWRQDARVAVKVLHKTGHSTHSTHMNPE